jgi:hypothetical protein
MVIGDFNLVRAPIDKNFGAFNASEAHMFNDVVNRIRLIEIPLLDRSYTWSNKRANPTLVRLDRCFVNVDWDSAFPNTSLASLTRTASDHVPLLTASTRVPKSRCFRFENAWLRHISFKELMTATLSPPVLGRPGAGMVRRLKTYRGVCRS